MNRLPCQSLPYSPSHINACREDEEEEKKKKELIPAGNLKYFVPHLISHRDEVVEQSKAGKGMHIELLKKSMTMPWMAQVDSHTSACHSLRLMCLATETCVLKEQVCSFVVLFLQNPVC